MKVSVIGLGVGYALSCALTEAGYEVVGVDISPDVIKNPRRDASVESLLRNRQREIREHLRLTTDYNTISESEVVIVCVSTGDEKKLVLGHVEDAIRSCLRILKGTPRHPIILVYSTLPFGSSKRIREMFEQEGLRIDEDISYCYMPLMIAQGTTANDFVNPPFVAFGSYSSQTAEKAMDFYLRFIQKSTLFNGRLPPHYATTPEIAELAKLVANAILSTKISFANMVAEFCEVMGLDGKKLLEIVGSDWRIGGAMLKPGYSFGGACFPRDLRSLIETFEEHNVSCPALLATNEINEYRTKSPLRVLHQLKLGNGKVLVLGLAYKAGIHDTRGSPSLLLIEALRDEGYDVETYDPNIDSNTALKGLLIKDAAGILIVTTRETEFISIGRWLHGTKIHTVLDFADIVDVSELPPKVRLYKAGVGWVK